MSLAPICAGPLYSFIVIDYCMPLHLHSSAPTVCAPAGGDGESTTGN